MKRFLLGSIIFLSFSVMSAETLKTHTVVRGETPESVAKKYGITVTQLSEANPEINFAEYFYSGMKINIPINNIYSKVQKQDNNKQNKSSKKKKNSEKKIKKDSSNLSNGQSQNPTKEKKHLTLKPSDFTSVSLLAGAESGKLVNAYYGIEGQYFRPSGFGATLIVNSSYGIESYGDIIVKIGPSYVYPITNKFYVEGTLAYTLTIAETSYTTGSVSGVSFMPAVGLSFNKFKIALNFEAFWRNGGGVNGGAFISIGYSI